MRRLFFNVGGTMTQNQVITERDNPVVVEFGGVDLTQATDIRVELGSTGQFVYLMSESPDVVRVISSSVLSLSLGNINLPSSAFHLRVTYFDANSVNGIDITSRVLGNLGRIDVDQYSDAVPFHPEFSDQMTSYVSYFEFMDYCYKRRLPVPKTTAEADKCLFDAMDYINSLESKFKGCRSTREQKYAFPRRGLELYGWRFDSNDVPDEVKRAQMELAAFSVENELFVNEVTENIKSEQLGPMRTEYFEGGQKVKQKLSRVNIHLAPLMINKNKLVRQ